MKCSTCGCDRRHLCLRCREGRCSRCGDGRRRRLLLAALLCWTVNATPVHVTDGDTFDVLASVWPSSIPKQAMLVPERIRVLGVNAPERKGDTLAAANAARDFTQRWLDGAELRLYACQRDSFGRLLATVTRVRDGANLSDDLVREGHAVPFKPR